MQAALGHILNREISATDSTTLMAAVDALRALSDMHSDRSLVVSAVVELDRQGVLRDTARYVEFVNGHLIRVVHLHEMPGDYKSLQTFERVPAEAVGPPDVIFAFNVAKLKAE